MEELTLAGVTRTFGDRRALDDVTFTVRPGRVTGLVGAVGAGRTTAARVAMGVLAPDTGTVSFGGRPLRDRRRFGYLPQERGLYPRMTVLDQLVFLARVHGVRPGPARRAAVELVDRLGLGERAGDPLQALSLADQQRVQVAATLVHDPVALVLDEPFPGLDRETVDVLTGMLRERADAGVPVLFTAHRLELVEDWCDDIVVLERGRVRAQGQVAQVRSAHAPRRLALVVEPAGGVRRADGVRGAEGADPVDDATGAVDDDATAEAPAAVPAALLADVLAVPGVALHEQRGCRLVLELTRGADDQAVLLAALRHARVRELAPVRATFAEMFPEPVR